MFLNLPFYRVCCYAIIGSCLTVVLVSLYCLPSLVCDTQVVEGSKSIELAVLRSGQPVKILDEADVEALCAQVEAAKKLAEEQKKGTDAAAAEQ